MKLHKEVRTVIAWSWRFRFISSWGFRLLGKPVIKESSHAVVQYTVWNLLNGTNCKSCGFEISFHIVKSIKRESKGFPLVNLFNSSVIIVTVSSDVCVISSDSIIAWIRSERWTSTSTVANLFDSASV